MTDLIDKILKLANGYDEGFIHVYRNKDGKLDAQWQYNVGSMDIEVESENYSQTMERIEATLRLDGDKFTYDEIIDFVERNEIEV